MNKQTGPPERIAETHFRESDNWEVVEHNVLPSVQTGLNEIQRTAHRRFGVIRGQIDYNLATNGQEWAVEAHHYDWDDFADEGPRVIESVKTFPSEEEVRKFLESTTVTPSV